jgi:outer membrane protein assembly factor BamD (BamD/ComL family)
MKSTCILFLAFIFFSSNLFGQYRFLNQAKEAIQEKNYTLALEKIKKYDKKESTDANVYYLMHLLYVSKSVNPEMADSAFYFFEKAREAYSGFNEKQQTESFKEIGLCEAELTKRKEELDILVYECYTKGKVLETLNQFLYMYYENPYKKEIEYSRDSLEFLQLENKTASYVAFIEKRKGSAWADRAKLRVHRLEFNLAKEQNTIEALQSFIENYPESKQVDSARTIIHKLAYNEAIFTNTESSISDFIKKYPSAPQVKEANWILDKLKWEKIKGLTDPDVFREFIANNPNSEYLKPAKQKYEESSWLKVKSTSIASAYQAFINEFPESDKRAEALEMIDKINSMLFPFLKENRKYALFNINSKTFGNQDEYDNIYLQANGQFIVESEKKYGVLNNFGKVIIPVTYECIGRMGKNYALTLGSKMALYDDKGSRILNFEYENISNVDVSDSSLILVSRTGDSSSSTKYGMVDRTGKFILDCIYNSIVQVDADNFIVQTNVNYFIINPKRKWQSKKYSSISFIGNGRFIVQTNGKYGVVNNNDLILINPTYKNLRSLDSNYLVFTSNAGRDGLMNSSGKEILPASFFEIKKISEKLLAVDSRKDYNENEKSRLYRIDQGKFVSEKQYSQIGTEREGMISFNNNDKIGYLNAEGQEVIAPLFNNLTELGYGDHDGYDGSEGGFICYSASDNQINASSLDLPATYNLSSDFYSELAVIQLNEKYGYINKRGEIQIPIVYTYAYAFMNNLAIVEKNISEGKNKILIIDKVGTVLDEDIQIVSTIDLQGAKLLYKKNSNYFTINLQTLEIEDLKIHESYENLRFAKSYILAKYKDKEVFITYNNELLMDANVDFSDYERDLKKQQAMSMMYSETEMEKAEDMLLEILRDKPNDYETNISLARLYVRKKESYNAKKYFDICISLKPNDADPIKEKLNYDYENNNWSDVLNSIRLLKYVDGYNLDAIDYFRSGYANSKQYNHRECIDDYTASIRLNNSYALSYNNRGVAYDNLGETILALNDYSRAIALGVKNDRGNLGLYYSNRGEIFKKLRRMREACADFKKGAALGNSNCRNNLRYCR